MGLQGRSRLFPGNTLLFLGGLALLMGIGGIRFTFAVYAIFDQNSHENVQATGEATCGPRPWQETWVVGYCSIAATLMSAGGVGLFLRRDGGLALTAWGGTSGVIASLGTLVYEALAMKRFSSWLLPPLWARPRGFFEILICGMVIVLGVLFAYLSWNPQRLGFQVKSAASTRRVAIAALLGWSVVSIATVGIFLHWRMTVWAVNLS